MESTNSYNVKKRNVRKMELLLTIYSIKEQFRFRVDGTALPKFVGITDLRTCLTKAAGLPSSSLYLNRALHPLYQRAIHSPAGHLLSSLQSAATEKQTSP